ncbi:MAG: tetratricopeptide repeat protein [Gammaproteobacteria bacterium]|nr:tetratricopeptide repeat protein [Gammaproteobacteria bacterium]MCP5140672.1 tetratricopeptide repeat protein [Chromatiales bacterium]
MSSLLDILQKKPAQPAADETIVAQRSAESHMQTVELHLAVDNRGTAEALVASDADDSMPELTIGQQQASQAAEQHHDAGTVADTFGGVPGDPQDNAADASQSFAVNQRRQRVRRNTSLLIGSLVLILLTVTTAISILLQYTANRGDDQSVVIPPEALQARPAQQQVSEVATPQPVVRPLRKEVADPPTAPPAAMVGKDTDWYDTPAVETPETTTQIKISRGTTENPLFPKLSEAWSAFQAADYAQAESLYREVQAADAHNVDALLGLAAIALRSDREQEAQSLYKSVLEADPKNSAAVAALSTLPAGASANGDTGNETRLKNMLREQPGAAQLHFALGLQYVSAGRWPEAQQAFFEAVRNEPVNADYAYNLAVSLDQLGQGTAAAAYYERALALANGSALFDAAAARQRLDSLRAAAR